MIFRIFRHRISGLPAETKTDTVSVMNEYQKEQLDALRMIRQCLATLDGPETDRLKNAITEYLDYRQSLAVFLSAHFQGLCTEKCFQGRLSACCSRDGIIAFFADAAINALVSDTTGLDHLETAIQRPERPDKCIFLSASGCLWKIKPIVCELFLCDEAEERIFGGNPAALATWEGLKAAKKRFTWPDRPVLFEFLEAFFLEKGWRSPLMYIHFSPGLARIKKQRKDS